MDLLDLDLYDAADVNRLVDDCNAHYDDAIKCGIYKFSNSKRVIFCIILTKCALSYDNLKIKRRAYKELCKQHNA